MGSTMNRYRDHFWKLARAKSRLSSRGGVGWTVATLLATVMVTTIFTTEARSQDIKKLRREAAFKPRQIIFSNDGDDVFAENKDASIETFLAARTTGLLDSQVGTVAYSTTRSFAYFTHDTEVCEVFTLKEGRLSSNITPGLIEQGTDPLKVMIGFCREHDLEVFWGMRVNDTHDTRNPLLRPRWKVEHPEYLMGTEDRPPRRGGWTRVDFGRKEVREMAFAVIEDVCRRYDVDGVELDFFRHPLFFRAQAYGGEATQEDCRLMTDLFRRVRTAADQAAQRRGKPILISMRMPDTVDYCRAIGIDLQVWLEEGLLDIMIPSGYFQLAPWRETVELCHANKVAVYPCLSNCTMGDLAARKRRMNIETYRARAMNVWASGADGIQIFNCFDPSHPLWRELGSPQTLQGLTKHYYGTYLGPRMTGGYLIGGQKYNRLPTLSPTVPVSLKPGQAHATTINVGEEVNADNVQGPVPRITLRLQVSPATGTDEITVSLNENPLGGGTMKDDWLEFDVAPKWLKQHENRVEIKLSEKAEENSTVRDLMLIVEYDG
jgi:hypothetical protein